MERSRFVQLELWQRLNVVGAMFCLWLGAVLGLGAAAVALNGLWATSRLIILPTAIPGLFLATYWFWKVRELQTGSFFQTVGNSDNDLVEMFRGRSRTFSFYSTIIGLIVLSTAAANFESVKNVSVLFPLFSLASVLFASYGASYLYFHKSS